jgi:hypothetical protein
MNFKKWVKSIQTAGYNGARTVGQIKKRLGTLNTSNKVPSFLFTRPFLEASDEIRIFLRK